MATVTLHLTTPAGDPLDLTVSPEDKGTDVQQLLERTEALAGWFKARGWHFADAQPTLPSVRELTSGPSFCGYPCSPTVDDAGFPTWILVGDRQAMRRDKQGDHWYSCKNGDGTFTQVLRIPKGEKVPPVVGLPTAA